MTIKDRLFASILTVIFLACSPSSEVFAQQKEGSSPADVPNKLTLVQATICEGIEEHSPKNRAIVFPITTGRVHCFTSFDPVPENTFVYHKWFFRDKLRARVKLSLETPSWSTFSRIRLQKGDKGPWRVDITDKQGNVFQILRFSVTD